ncbi:MAG TPA: LacI family DNA-binding transcriptional regulator [Ignavibacteriales bacterium]|nr:LacI family DNA-binding transcriptional regulator [Ignavibacteriales bacterium]
MIPTIKDVARKANVSIATVSLVIHNHKRISDETRTRVNKAIKELNYHPSRSARGLVSRKTGNIAFIVTEDHFLRSEPFYTRIFLGTEFEARQNEYYILLTIIKSDFKKGDRLPRCVLERNVDGVIIAGKVPEDIITCLEKYDFPLNFVDYSPPADRYPVVLIDNFSGGMQAVQHLISLGHKHIGFVAGDIQHPSIRDRFQGYKIALENADINYNSTYSVTDENYPARENGYHAAKKLLKANKKITAIFSCNDAMAIGVMQYLKEAGMSIPEDVSVIGFDDVEAGLSLDPPLSTIGVPKIEMGSEVMRLMADILNGKVTSPKKVLIPVELIERKSTGPARL